MFLFGFEKDETGRLACPTTIPVYLEMFQSVTLVTQSRGLPLCSGLIMQKGWVGSGPKQGAPESKPGLWRPQTQPARPQAQLPVAGPTGLRLRICQCLGFSRPRVSYPARVQLRLPAICLHGTGFTPHLRHAECKIHCILLSLK